MIELHKRGSRRGLLKHMIGLYPIWPELWKEARECVGRTNKREVWEEQAAAIAFLASQYRGENVRILEIGCNHGLTAGLMQLASPFARVTTLEPEWTSRVLARQNVASLGVVVRHEKSKAFWAATEGSGIEYDLIFVDGDHNRVALDFSWLNRLKVGGLFLFHDYSPAESGRPCVPVYEALNEFGAKMEREPDVLVVDDTGIGLWGMYRRDGEVWK